MEMVAHHTPIDTYAIDGVRCNWYGRCYMPRLEAIIVRLAIHKFDCLGPGGAARKPARMV